MLISVRELSKLWNVEPLGVIHVGAHEGEEAKEYSKFNWRPTVWIEAQPEKVELLKEKFSGSEDSVIQAAVWGETGIEMELSISSKSMSSSLLGFAEHSKLYPKIIEVERVQISTVTLDDLLPNRPKADFLNLDIQGAELEALKGFSNGIKNLKWIYTEVNSREIYKNCPLVDEIDKYLKEFNFVRTQTRWWQRDGWGDALYVRTDLIKKDSLRIRCLKFTTQLKWKTMSLFLTAIRFSVRYIKLLFHSSK